LVASGVHTPIAKCPVDLINEPDEASELDDLRSSAQRVRPFGSEDWTINIAKQLGLEANMHSRGRPKRK